MSQLDRYSPSAWQQDGVFMQLAPAVEKTGPKRKGTWTSVLVFTLALTAPIVSLAANFGGSGRLVQRAPVQERETPPGHEDDFVNPDYWAKVRGYIQSAPQLPPEAEGDDPDPIV